MKKKKKHFEKQNICAPDNVKKLKKHTKLCYYCLYIVF